MAWRRVVGAELEAGAGPHPAGSPYDQDVGRALGVTAFGVYRVALPAGAATVAHDHRDDGAEDLYAAIEGAGVLVVDGEEHPFVAGDFVAVTPGSERYVRAGAGGLVLLAVCAPLAG